MSSDTTSAKEPARRPRTSRSKRPQTVTDKDLLTSEDQNDVLGSDAVPVSRRAPQASNRSRIPEMQAPARRASPSITPGDELEMRLARVWFWEGTFARRGINLQQHFTDENFTITDLDLLALDITGQLEVRRTIGEAKSGTGRDAPKPMDRCLWLAGVSRLVNAVGAEYVTASKVSRSIREIAVRLDVRPMTIDDLRRREEVIRVDEVPDVGSHGPTALKRAQFALKHAKNERQWERAYWFVRCEVWFLDPWQATKRCIGLLDSLAGWWTPEVDDDDQSLLRWLYAEALGVFALNVVLLAGSRIPAQKSDWQSWATDKLTEGAIPMHQMKVFAAAVDRYTAGLLGKLNAPPSVHAAALGSFMPESPDWAESLLELVERLAADPLAARNLPRHVDLVVHERLVHRRHVNSDILDRVDQAQGFALDRMRRQLTAFLRGYARLPAAVDKALGTTTSAVGRENIGSETVPHFSEGTPTQDDLIVQD